LGNTLLSGSDWVGYLLKDCPFDCTGRNPAFQDALSSEKRKYPNPTIPRLWVGSKSYAEMKDSESLIYKSITPQSTG
jgi:hypothetical protein